MKRLLTATLLGLILLGLSLTAQTPQPHTTKLGASLFWAIRGLESYPQQLDANLRWIRTNLGADYVRVIVALGGDKYRAADGNYYDPWENASVYPLVSIFEQRIAQTTDHIYDNYGLKVHWTIVGSGFHSETRPMLDSLADHFALQIRGREHKVELVEAWNEYGQNGGNVADLQYLGRRLRANLGATFPIALSSPEATHHEATETALRTEIGQMFAGPDFGGASVFVYHASRTTSRWRPATILRVLGPVPRYNSEPRGPGASAGGDVSDPATLAQDYRESIQANEAGYVYHSMPGVWGGHAVGFPDQNRWKNLWEVPNAEAIAAGLKALRGGPTTPANPVPQLPSDPLLPTPSSSDPIAVLMDLVRRVEILEAIARRAGLMP